MESKTIILAADASLVGKGLGNVYRHFEQKSTFGSNVDAKFKKKEALGEMAKSILKHRIKSLTGKSVQEIEAEMDYRSSDEAGFSVEELRRIAQLLILEAAGELIPLAGGSQSGGVLGEEAKRPRAAEIVKGSPFKASPVKPAAKLKAGRKSLAPEMLKNGRSRSNNLEVTREDVGEDVDDVAMLDLGPNPTPQMIARKRRSIAVMNTSKNARKTPSRGAVKTVAAEKEESNKVTIGTKATKRVDRLIKQDEESAEEDQPKVARASRSTRGNKRAAESEEKGEPTKIAKIVKSVVNVATKIVPKTPSISFVGDKSCKVYLAQSQLQTLNLKMIQARVPEFQGASLIVLHTPISWDPTDVFNLVLAVRSMNKKAELETFSLLVGCGLTNVHLFREALCRQTKHVQFVVFEKQDADAKQITKKLRDVNSFFLVAYFFKGCLEEEPEEIPQMVRVGATTCFHTKNVEDLENQIMHTFSEEGDWLLDIFCGGRELSLAAQKMGRNALALHDTLEPLTELKKKAGAIASHFDGSFDQSVEGSILQI